ncbi:hypothetical protein P691DRAFT_833598 [Macrolepiota fuliginosa MF-IS2]|uniref:Uncharacterized protein n=1 Tax=Macrolepiota fuliginosa MF-IS2 TaxID=1400762 RepID=A0A9P5WXE8_9AGAR|nr:hypothetical protein P691DRAFT_833598 [Macrolepiota fuliginosa MF-IS2]
MNVDMYVSFVCSGIGILSGLRVILANKHMGVVDSGPSVFVVRDLREKMGAEGVLGLVSSSPSVRAGLNAVADYIFHQRSPDWRELSNELKYARGLLLFTEVKLAAYSSGLPQAQCGSPLWANNAVVMATKTVAAGIWQLKNVTNCK